jgi:FADH2 O2-dependent halogenase
MRGLRASMKPERCQVAVIGSGFAGSLAAMVARQLGFSTMLIERGRHPRFVIGESSTPLANLLLEEIADEYGLPFLRPLSKWGTWQKELPHIGCGLKRGFTFYQHQFHQPFAPDPQRLRQLLVGASPNEAVADTHWYRPDFDSYLVERAKALGVDYRDETNLTSVGEETNGLRLFGADRRGQAVELFAEFVMDATGPRGFLHRALKLPERTLHSIPATQALYSHFTDVGELPGEFFGNQGGLPYPPEQAAVHHVFPGGWIWVLKFNNGITSAGVAATEEVAKELRLKEGEPAWRRLLSRLPSLQQVFQSSRAVVPFIHAPRLPFQSGVVAGSRWILLPYAAGFVDPLLSTGFPLSLLGITRIGIALKQYWGTPEFRQSLEAYASITTLELEASARLVGALYATMNSFELFCDLGLLYFAAAIYSEVARRLGKPQLADSFLLCRHPEFGPQLKRLFETVTHPGDQLLNTTQLSRQIHELIQPFDLAGLTDASRRPWFPALADDLFANAHKVGSGEHEIREMLQRCGFGVHRENIVPRLSIGA